MLLVIMEDSDNSPLTSLRGRKEGEGRRGEREGERRDRGYRFRRQRRDRGYRLYL